MNRDRISARLTGKILIIALATICILLFLLFMWWHINRADLTQGVLFFGVPEKVVLYGNVIKILDTAGGRTQSSFSPGQYPVTHAVYEPESECIFLADKSAKIYRLSITDDKMRSICQLDGPVVGFGLDQKNLIIVNHLGECYTVALDNAGDSGGQAKANRSGELGSPVREAWISPDGSKIAFSREDDSSIGLYEHARNNIEYLVPRTAGTPAITDFEFLADRSAVYATSDGDISLLSWREGFVESSEIYSLRAVHWPHLSSNGGLTVVADQNLSKLIVIDAGTLESRAVSIPPSLKPRDVFVNQQGDKIAVIGSDRKTHWISDIMNEQNGDR